LILLAGSALTFALFGSRVAVAQARKGAETIQTSQDLSAAPLGGPAWFVVAVDDFNGDSKPDYALVHFTLEPERQTAIWYMNNNIFVSGAYGPTLPANWFLVGVCDFNGDSKPDYVLFNFSTRQTAVWYMNNNIFVSGAFGPTLPANWSLVAVGDFNGDSKPDYVLFNVFTRQTAIWYMNNNIFVSGAYGPTLPAGWTLEGVADFNGDSKPDYVLFNNFFNTRQTAIWYMNNNVFVSGAYGPILPSGWILEGVADFNGDSKPDYVLFNFSTRQTAIWYMNNNIFVSGAYGPTLPPG
jgi:elongation factor P hydroxylase